MARNIEKARDIVRRVDELRATGISTGDACLQCEVGRSTYTYHKKNLKNADKKEITFTTLPAKSHKKQERKTNGKLALIVGSREEIKALIEGWV